MKLNVVAIRIWLITFGLILFTFVATTIFYGYFYSEQVEENYMNDYEEFILNVENLVEGDPHFLLNNLEEINNLHSRVNFAFIHSEEYSANEEDWLLRFPNEVYETIENKPGVIQNIDSEVDIHIRSDNNPEHSDNIPYVFHVNHMEIDGEGAILYSYADLSFFVQIENTMTALLTGLIAVYALLAFGYYFYLKRSVAEPINAMTNIAFDYSRDDFSRQLPVAGRDDLSELAMAMNKMGHSLETNRRAVRQEKELLSHIMNNIDTGILYYDPNKALLLSNPAGDVFLTQYYEEKESFGDLEEFVDVDEKIKEAAEEKSVVQFEIEMEEFYYNGTVLPLIEEENGEIRGILVSTQDLTYEHRLDKMRVDFINNISHELRTPLVMVQGYSEAILDDVADTIEEKKEMATIIRDEAQRMNRMVNEMLDLSRMEAGFIDIRKDRINLHDYFTKLKSRFDKMAMEQHVDLEVVSEDPELQILMDRDKMDQVFVNLMNNAIRHTGMTDKESKVVYLRVFKDPHLDEVIMEIRDTGTGIPKEDMPYIFDRFFKADKSRKNYADNAAGTGIGLSLVQSIVQAHDGRIDVESEAGEGAAFIIYLPYVLEEVSEEE